MLDLKTSQPSNKVPGIFSRLVLRKVREKLRAHRRISLWILILAIVLSPIVYEIRTSAFSSRFLANYAKKLSYQFEPGPSPNIIFPKHGPFDVRAGYALIPEFERRLIEAGYQIKGQVRFSPELLRAAKWGIRPPYSEPTFTKLTIQGKDGQPLFQSPLVEFYFNSFEEIPSLAIKGLLIIENRELDEPKDYRTNPVVDWDRLAKAALLYAGNKLGLPLPVEGGSTLATQMEKYRHSDEGRTDSVLAKLQQMTEASLKVYQNGMDTRDERRQIVLNYLNSVPLAAVPGYGEVHGVGNGLNAWFNLNLHDAQRILNQPGDSPEKARIFKHIVALLCSVKAPSYFLIQNHNALNARANFYIRYLAKAQGISDRFSKQTQAVPLVFSMQHPAYPRPAYAESKATNQIRSKLASLLGVPGFYELNRLDLSVESTIDPQFQHKVSQLFEKLHDPDFITEQGLRGERLLQKGDPSKVIYGMMLLEKTPQGNFLRSTTDTLNAPFDINTGMKMQLGSTAKLRTLVHYLDIIAALHNQYSVMSPEELGQAKNAARDPLTLWVLDVLNQDLKPDMDQMLQWALDRKYSANPRETFFTGGGIHEFHNFQKTDNGRILMVREATKYSVNLVYVRLMRDIVKYYEAHLPYDIEEVLKNYDNPMRQKLLQESSEEESKYFLYQAYKAFKKIYPETIIYELLGDNAASAKHLAITFYAWNHDKTEQALSQWLAKHLDAIPENQIRKLIKSYGNPQLNLADYGYLLGIHPLKLWCAGEIIQNPQITWKQLWSKSHEVQKLTAAWLFKAQNRSAQDKRLRIRFEQDAFSQMTPVWKRLGFPFDRLVPSLATALGSSGDRPEALAQLMGILMNDGYLKPIVRITQLHFAHNTPYETVLEPVDKAGIQVIPQSVARAILPVLAQVVQGGTAARLASAITNGERPLIVGGKTGSGDNRFESVGRGGQIISSNPVDRTAVFVFYIEDRYWGVITVYVPGNESGDFGFTSSLPVAILKLLAPDIQAMWTNRISQAPTAIVPTAPGNSQQPSQVPQSIVLPSAVESTSGAD
jgi:membrane peptidoglycan carboxypeptidase